MQVEILYPTLGPPGSVVDLAAPAYRFGPYPLIVFAHGYNVDPNTYRALLASWAGAGYVVAAPFFPDTSLPAVAAQQGADTESDMFNQPGDVAFVVSQVVAAAGGSAANARGLPGGPGEPCPAHPRGPVGRGRHRRRPHVRQGLRRDPRLDAGQADRRGDLLRSRDVPGGRRLLGSARRTARARRPEPHGRLQLSGQQLPALQHAPGPQVVPRHRQLHASRPVCGPRCRGGRRRAGDGRLLRPRGAPGEDEPCPPRARRQPSRGELSHERAQPSRRTRRRPRMSDGCSLPPGAPTD